MMQIWSFLFLIGLPLSLFSQEITGTVTNEDGHLLPAVLVFNMSTKEKTYTRLNGSFILAASVQDEIRFVRVGYDRFSIKLTLTDLKSGVMVRMIRTPEEIEEVRISSVKLSGDISRDSRLLDKEDKVEKLQNEIGVPKNPEKPREKPTEVSRDILLPMAFGQLNVQGIYNVISGKAKRQKRLYTYEDLHESIRWIRERLDDDYFVKAGISQNKITEFLEFSISTKPDLTKYIKAKNLSKVMLNLEETLPKYLNR